MIPALVIIVPRDLDDPPEWLRVENGMIVSRGCGDDWGKAPDDPDATLLIVPTAAITLHRAALPDLASRQAAAAARLLGLESSLGRADELHVATSARDVDGGLDIAVVRKADMAGWLLWAQHRALDPGTIVPAALLLPRPEKGFVAGRVGKESLLRDASSAFADDGLRDLLVGNAVVELLPPERVDAAFVEMLAASPLNLRQGTFAQRRRPVDRGAVQRAAILVALILLATLATALIRIARLHADTAARNAAVIEAAQAVGPGVITAAQAEAAVNARLAARGLAGRGFIGPTAELLSAMQEVPGVTLTTLARTGDGALAATLMAPNVGEIHAVLGTLKRAGYLVVAEPPQNQGGRNAIAITMVAP